MSRKNDEIKHLLDLDPETLDEKAAVDVAGGLLSASKSIDWQLSSKERTGADGQKLDPSAYKRWRKGAIKAKNHIEERYRLVKERIKQLRRAKYEQKNA